MLRAYCSYVNTERSYDTLMVWAPASASQLTPASISDGTMLRNISGMLYEPETLVISAANNTAGTNNTFFMTFRADDLYEYGGFVVR